MTLVDHLLKRKILIVSVFMACFGGSMLFGYNLAVINSPTKFIEAFYERKYEETSEKKPTKTQVDLFITILNSSFVVTGFIGSLISGFIANLWGRKICLLLCHIPMILGSIGEGISLSVNVPILLIVGRASIGLSSGVAMTVLSMYLAEIASQDTRGAIGSCNQLFLAIGILLAQILGLNQLFGTEELWPLILAASGVFAFISGVVFIFCPESPRYLVTKGKMDEAKLALKKFTGEENVDEAIEAMSQDKTESLTMLQFFTAKNVYLATALSLAVHLALQWSGINSIFFYSERIFKAVDIAETNIGYAILGTGIVMLLATVVAIPLFEKLGRRPLLLISLTTMIISLTTLSISLTFVNDNKSAANSTVTTAAPAQGISAAGVLTFSMLLIFIAGFGIGVGPLTWPVSAELFRQDCRGPALAFSGGANWMAFFIVSMTFPSLNNLMGPYVFLLYAVFLLLVDVFFFFKLPETKNKTFEEIALEMSNAPKAPDTQAIN